MHGRILTHVRLTCLIICLPLKIYPMNIPNLFLGLQSIPLFQGIPLGILLIVLLTLAYLLPRWQLSLIFFAAVYGVLGIFLTNFFPYFYGLLIWICGFVTTSILAVTYHQRPVRERQPIDTPLFVIGFILSPLLLAAVSGLVALWPAIQIAGRFDLSWIIFLLLSLSLWQMVRSSSGLGRTVGFLIFLAGLGLWQAVSLNREVVIAAWAGFSLIVAFLGVVLFSRIDPGKPAPSEFPQPGG